MKGYRLEVNEIGIRTVGQKVALCVRVFLCGPLLKKLKPVPIANGDILKSILQLCVGCGQSSGGISHPR